MIWFRTGLGNGFPRCGSFECRAISPADNGWCHCRLTLVHRGAFLCVEISQATEADVAEHRGAAAVAACRQMLAVRFPAPVDHAVQALPGAICTGSQCGCAVLGWNTNARPCTQRQHLAGPARKVHSTYPSGLCQTLIHTARTHTGPPAPVPVPSPVCQNIRHVSPR